MCSTSGSAPPMFPSAYFRRTRARFASTVLRIHGYTRVVAALRACLPLATLGVVRRACPVLLASLTLAAGCNSGDSSSAGPVQPHAAPRVAGLARAGDWTRYGFDAQRSNVGP